MDQRAFLGAPSDPFVQALAAMLMQVLNDPCALVEIVPEQARIAQMEFVVAVSEDFGKARVVKQQASIFALTLRA